MEAFETLINILGIIFTFFLAIFCSIPIFLLIDLFTGCKISGFFERIFKKIRKRRSLWKVKKQEQMELKKNNSICYDALIFEYSEVYKFVNQIIEKNKKEEFIVVQSYLILLNKYYNEILKLRKVEKNSVEFFACVLKAIEEKPVFYNIEKRAFVTNVNGLLRDIRDYIIANYKELYYGGQLVTFSNKNDIKSQAEQENHSEECISNIYKYINFILDSKFDISNLDDEGIGSWILDRLM